MLEETPKALLDWVRTQLAQGDPAAMAALEAERALVAKRAAAHSRCIFAAYKVPFGDHAKLKEVQQRLRPSLVILRMTGDGSITLANIDAAANLIALGRATLEV